MGKGHDARVTDQQIIAGDQHDEDAYARCHFLAAHVGKQQGCEKQADGDDADQPIGNQPAGPSAPRLSLRFVCCLVHGAAPYFTAGRSP